MNRRLRQPSWEEPLRTKHAAIARYQRSMLVCKALLLLTTLVIAAWVGIQQRDFPGNLGEGLLLGLLVPVAALLVASVYQLVVRLEDGDSPVFLGLTALVPVFNLLLVFISTTWHGNTFASRASPAAERTSPPRNLPPRWNSSAKRSKRERFQHCP